MHCVLNNLKEVPTLSKHLNSLESQKTKNRKKPENITEEIREKEAEKIALTLKGSCLQKSYQCDEKKQYLVPAAHTWYLCAHKI